MKLPRNAQIWAVPYLRNRFGSRLSPRPAVRRMWLAITDHYEPMWDTTDLAIAHARVQRWYAAWPRIAAASVKDTCGHPPQYTFFYPEEEYRSELLEPLASMTHAGIADVEVHIHHDGDGRQSFVNRMAGFCTVLRQEHGLLHEVGGRIRFGFIHGNWALDNSRPDGRWCGLNDEIEILRDLGCYADFTMPSGSSPTQSRMLNTIYWCADDPTQPKSYDTGTPLRPGQAIAGDLLMIPGPFGVRWTERLLPRLESGEISASDPPTASRIRLWFELAPEIEGDVFIKLYTHGAQEKNSAMLLGGGLEGLFRAFTAEACRRTCQFFFVTAWQMYLAIDAVRRQVDPVEAVCIERAARMALPSVPTSKRNPCYAASQQDRRVVVTEKKGFIRAAAIQVRQGCSAMVGVIGAPEDIFRAVAALAGASVRIIVIVPERSRVPMQRLLSGEMKGLARFESSEYFHADRLSELDVLVNTSPAAHPLLFEAVAHSVAVVTVNSPDLTPMFCHGRSALFFSQGEHGQIRELVFNLLEDGVKRKALATEALRRMQREYAMSYITRDYSWVMDPAFGMAPTSVHANCRAVLKRVITNVVPKRWLVLRGDSARHEFAITFDDGPDPLFTPVVLKILREFDVKATFYLVGNRAEQFPELVQAIAADCHEVANHSYTHPCFHRMGLRRAKHELAAAERAVRFTGVGLARQFRPPFGKLSWKSLMLAWSMGLTVVMASVDLKDYAATSASDVVRNLATTNIGDGDIVLYHAINDAAVAALPTVLEAATRGGRRGVTVSQLMRA